MNPQPPTAAAAPRPAPPGPAERAPLLHCRQLVVGHHGRALLPPIDLTVREGSFWAVIGRNGSGKTTWFLTLLGLLPPVAGHVEWPRRDVRLSYIPQRSDVDPLFPARVGDVVAYGAERRFGFLGPRRPLDLRRRVALALERTEAAALAGRAFRDLSEGQKQRVLLARMAAGEPELALLDEPTAAMDVRAEEETLRLIERLRRQYGMAVVIVSHFLGVASQFAEHVLLVAPERRAVFVGTPAEVLNHVDFAGALPLGAAGAAPGGAAEGGP